MHPRQIAWPRIGLCAAFALILGACGGVQSGAGQATATSPAATQVSSPTTALAASAAMPQQQDAIKVTVWTHGGTAETTTGTR